jgi:mono/diheme cytochrome c family protein
MHAHPTSPPTDRLMIELRQPLVSFAIVASLLAFLTLEGGLVNAQEPTSNVATLEMVKAFVAKHCLECHGEKEAKADLNLAFDRDVSSMIKRRGVWESLIEMVSSGQMPPPEKPRPDQTEIDQFISGVNALFDDADQHAKPDPGRVTVRRLNRTEYNNTIRDLMFIDFNAAEDFPSDDIGHGFDNIGDVLTMSPILMERYLAAAETIVQKAILVGEPPKPPKRRSVATFLKTTRQEAFEVPFRTLDANGKLSITHKLPVEGEYKFSFHGWGRQVGGEPVRAVFQIDGKDYDPVEVKSTAQEKATYVCSPVQLGAGEHLISLAFLNEFTDPAAEKPEESKRALFVEYFEFEGPHDMVPPSHKRLLACNPEDPRPEQARQILTRFLTRAYRRPATPAEIDRLVGLTMRALDEGVTWEVAMQRAMMTTLVSPKFLFRLELDDRPESPEPQALDEYQLASRMSYFLWSTMPDDELFALASKGELTANLDHQVRRMLADPKSDSLVDNFAMQWLQLKRLKTIAPDPKLFPTFNDQLRAAMLKETELFFEAIIREDRSVGDIIDADFTFLNRPLAQHYGLQSLLPEPPEGERRRGRGRGNADRDFQRVTLPDKLRGGLLTQASVLTVTSNPTRTSPVKRGRWILEQILGAPPPPPPPNVPELAEGEKAQLTGSLRQRMEQHRANPACANCHAKMDPLGFGFENYNAIGGFREKDGDFPVEAGGVLPGGRTFQGPVELKSILSEQRAKVGRNLTEKLMIYALGRGLEYYDRPSIKKIQEELAKNDYKFSTLAIEIVKSDPFRMRRGSD